MYYNGVGSRSGTCGDWGRFWTETVAEERFLNMRVEEALGTGAEVLVTGCPFFMSNSGDSVIVTFERDGFLINDIA